MSVEQGNTVRVKIENVSKSFISEEGIQIKVIDDVSFEVYDNEFLVLLGPGRCGKSVLLNLIAGLDVPDNGKIYLDGKMVSGPNPAMGMVFQRTGLLPWLNVIDNVRFGPRMRKVPLKEQLDKAQHYIDLVNLSGFERHYPYQLSGGMKQRVGIARAYANDPKILIMDEPFGALDAQTRYSMENEVLTLTESDKRTVIFVTNNIEEALLLGDRIILFTLAPARVKEIYEVPFKKPRDTIDKDFLRLRTAISDNTDLAL